MYGAAWQLRDRRVFSFTTNDVIALPSATTVLPAPSCAMAGDWKVGAGIASITDAINRAVLEDDVPVWGTARCFLASRRVSKRAPPLPFPNG